MRLRTDDRGVTVQVGTVLLFAVLIVLLSTYQASVVPQQNEQVEFNHNQRVQGQMQDLRDELLRTAVTGSGGSSSVALGTRYPVRAVFVNPAPPSGTLATTPAANVSIRNATADGEVGDYWTGSARNFSTHGLTYDPLYHVYQNPPTTVFRNGVLYNRYPDANRTLSTQRLVRGNRISLVALNGSLSESATGSATVDFRAVSAATRTVTVRNGTANLSVVVPTSLPEGEAVGLWRNLLADQLNQSRGDDRRVLAVEAGPRPGVDDVRIVLEPGTYELQLAKVGLGSDVTGVEPRYATDVRGDNASVAEDSAQRLVVEVRDRYNNPVRGARVNATLVSSGLSGDAIAAQNQRSETDLTDLRTDSEGRVTLRYDAVENLDDERSRSVEVRVSADRVPGGGSFRTGAPLNLSFNLSVVNTDGSGLDGGADDGDEYDVDWTDWGEELDCTKSPCEITVDEETTIPLTASVTTDDGSLANATVDYAVNDTSVGWTSPVSGETDGDGRHTTSLTVRPVNDTMTVYAASGDDVVPMSIRVRNPGGGPEGPADPAIDARVVDRDANGNADYRVSYSVTDYGDSFDRVEITYDNARNSWGDGASGAITDPRSTDTFTAGGVGGHSYNITIRAYDDSDRLVAQRSLVDSAAADGTSPDDNDPIADLREPDSPSIANATIADESTRNGGAAFEVAYNATRGNETYPTVRVRFRNLDNGWATETLTSDGKQGAVSHSTGGTYGNDYEIVVSVVDDDGIVVDEAVYAQQADGDDGT